MKREMTLKAMNVTETFVGLTATPRTLTLLSSVNNGTYRMAARRALKQHRQSQTSSAFSHDNHYVHSCWVM